MNAGARDVLCRVHAQDDILVQPRRHGDESKYVATAATDQVVVTLQADYEIAVAATVIAPAGGVADDEVIVRAIVEQRNDRVDLRHR